MRDAFANAITELAAQDERVCLLVGDLGNHLWDNFRERFPDRWYNAGIAEGNMVSVAAGLALAGLRPFVYSIASFATYRCYEQIRVDVCYHNLPVVIVGVGAGLSYAKLGPTHHACEDVAVMRALPNMDVICPCDPVETRLVMRGLLGKSGPTYLRLGKNGEPTLHPTYERWVFSLPYTIREGADVCLMATGPITAVALQVANLLGEKGVSAEVSSWHTIKPLYDAGMWHAHTYPLIVTIEEHSLVGGFGAAVAEWRADRINPDRCMPLLRFGTDDAFFHNVGDRSQALEACGLTAEKIAGKILEALR